ncbi:hypothetical protein THICB1_110451 [Thiomonas arsenitoxydans]|uniref:Uncharacterized protein n=1 Tax=Thiomonas arsenitoxydans (strain DSM 22701 / CIP 110005 / 3As) TaxID=426114 RepID=A0ABM9T262_THIA3|nr:hypothetical protein THICB1_110451 [Thiomonas arsenitoxydans]CQR30994.1 hypothetical protein THICB6_150514 [Thiomonas arsenitoxydans]
MLQTGDILRQTPHGGQHQRPGQLGGDAGVGLPIGYGDAQITARLHIHMRADPAGLHHELQLGALFQQLPRQHGAVANQHQRLGVAQAHAELTYAFDGVVEYLEVVTVELLRAIELAHRILIVVEHGDLHGYPSDETPEPISVGPWNSAEERRRSGRIGNAPNRSFPILLHRSLLLSSVTEYKLVLIYACLPSDDSNEAAG